MQTIFTPGHTTISCGQHRHTVLVDTHGRFVTEATAHHDNIDDTITKMAVSSALGSPVVAPPGCVALLALLHHGVAYVVEHGDLGPWRALWIRYEQNPLVRQLQNHLKHQRREQLRPLFEAVLRPLHRVRRGLTRVQTRELTRIVPDDSALLDGHIVGFFTEDHWFLPVASDWLTTCAAQPIVDGKLVLARTADAVFVLEQDTDSDRWRVKKRNVAQKAA